MLKRFFFNPRLFISPILAVLLLVLSSCSKPSNPAPVVIQEAKPSTQDVVIAQLQQRMIEQERTISQLKAQLDARPKQVEPKVESQPPPPKNDDPVDRFKSSISSFAKTYEAQPRRMPGNWSAFSYDITKTDSVVSPLFAVVILKQEFGKEFKGAYGNIHQRYKVGFALQDGVWVIKSLTDTGYTIVNGGERDTSPFEVKIGDETDPLYPFTQFLQKHFK